MKTESLTSFVRCMKALSDPTRVKIVKLLEQRELCVCEIREALHYSQPTISKHLKILLDAGLVVGRKEKMWVNYSLARPSDDEHARLMLEHVAGRLTSDPEVTALLAQLPMIHRENLCKS